MPNYAFCTCQKHWLNEKKLRLCIEYIKNKNIRETHTPILHPYFYFFPSKIETCGETRLSILCRYFSENNINLFNLNIIEIGSHISYFSQHFCRMGANVTSVEKDKTSFDLACLLNELLFCDSIKMVNCDIRNIEYYR